MYLKVSVPYLRISHAEKTKAKKKEKETPRKTLG
jgi:hypothetical protein